MISFSLWMTQNVINIKNPFDFPEFNDIELLKNLVDSLYKLSFMEQRMQLLFAKGV